MLYSGLVGSLWNYRDVTRCVLWLELFFYRFASAMLVRATCSSVNIVEWAFHWWLFRHGSIYNNTSTTRHRHTSSAVVWRGFKVLDHTCILYYILYLMLHENHLSCKYVSKPNQPDWGLDNKIKKINNKK